MASFNNGRGRIYKETALDGEDCDGNEQNGVAHKNHTSEKKAIMDKSDEDDTKKKSTTCVLL